MVTFFRPKPPKVDEIPEAHEGALRTANVDFQTGVVVDQKSRQERLFVARLDAILLVYCCFASIIKGLDQQNLSAAYVSGLKEDLNIQQNEYNFFTTYFNIGYALFVIPSQIMMTRFRPSLWLPGLEFAWGVLTIAFYQVKSAKEIFAFRAFIGAMEGSAYPGGATLLMAWYTPRELAFRIGFFHSSAYIGNMFAGGLQAAIYNSLDGRGGLAGWRWMFIVDGIVTIFIAIAGFFCIPDYPSKPNKLAFWLKPRHLAIARERGERFRRTDVKRFTFSALVRASKQPLLYMIPTTYAACLLAQQGYQYFNLFLKSLKNPNGTSVWSVESINAIPIAGNAIAVVFVWIYGFLSDYLQTRWLIVMIQALVGLIPAIIMTIWNVPLGAKYFAYFLCYTFIATTPPIFAWVSDMTPNDPEQRAVIVGCCIMGFYGINSWSNVLVWPASKAPHYPVAWQVSIGLWIFVILMLFSLRYLEIKHIRPRNTRIAAENWDAAQLVGATEQVDVGEKNEKNDDGNMLAAVADLERR